jgi:CDP-glycerol glycerophosphotransferase
VFEGDRPLREGLFDLYAGAPGADEGDMAPVMVSAAIRDRLPLGTVARGKPFDLAGGRDDRVLLSSGSELRQDELGPYNQRRLRETVFLPGRDKPLRDAVVYSSFSGRQYSDNPRAIHEELLRRDSGLEHIWVVWDGRYQAPSGATAVRLGSREHYEALSTARYVVHNDHFPVWFSRRDDQICLQTWHGTPLKRLGFDVSAKLRSFRTFEYRWREQVRNWQLVLSPNAFSTPILRRAYGVEGEMLETGYPRNDVLARPDRDEASRRVRQRLGLRDDQRAVLYAPTFRDYVRDRKGRFRLDVQLDLDRLRDAVGDDTVVLFRKHHYIADAVPVTADGFVRDVSTYPDGTELMLAADVLMTDYSSMMFDYANTGRPMLFFTYDLEVYDEEIRGFYFDFMQTSPGPLLRTSDDVAAALQDLDGVTASYRDRYADFAKAFCELDDGRAAARVVDRVFGPSPGP